MKRPRFLRFAFLSALLLGFSLSAFAQGWIFPWPPRPPQPGIPLRMPVLQKATLHFDLNGQAGNVILEQVWKNPWEHPFEGRLVIPLPDGSQVTQFAMAAGDTVYKGKILERDKARQIYEDIVRQLRDPALLEFAGHNLFRSQVFPLRPHEKRRIRVQYSVVFPFDHNQVRLEFPFGAPRASGALRQNKASLVVDGQVTSTVPIKNAYSPNAGVDVFQSADTQLKISFEGALRKLQANSLRIFYSLDRDPVGISALTFRKGKAPGFFLLFVSPELSPPEETLPADFVFILDRSGSMSGEKIQQAKTALKYCLNHLKSDDRFALFTFSSEVRALAPKLLPVDAGRKRALDFVDSVEAAGGTNIDDALTKITRFRSSPDRPLEVVFLTDGKPTVGVTDEKEILEHFSRMAGKNLRLFIFGVGFDVNTFLLNRLSEARHGTVVYVEPGANLEQRMTNFFDKIRSPVLTGLTMDWNGLGVRDVFPKKLPDLFRGSQLVLAGRYENPGTHTLVLRGKMRAGRKTFKKVLSFPSENVDNDFVPTVWASRKIGYLLDQIRLNGQSDELKNEIIRLSKKYGIVTPYTSYLIRNPEAPVAGVPPRPLGPPPGGRRPRFGAERARMGLLRDFVSKGQNRSGAAAFYISSGIQNMKETRRISNERDTAVRFVAGRTFVWQDSVWAEEGTASEPPDVQIAFGSPAYFDLLNWYPELKDVFALGSHLIFRCGSKVVKIADKGKEKWSEDEARKYRKLAP